MAAWKKKVQDIVAASQESQTCHDRLMQDLRQIYDSVSSLVFLDFRIRIAQDYCIFVVAISRYRFSYASGLGARSLV